MLKLLWKLPDHVQHCVVAAFFMAVVGLVWGLLGLDLPAVVGAVFAVAFYYGREVRDVEIHNAGLPGRPGMNDPAVLLPWRWHYRDSLTDFLWPLGSCSAIAALFELGVRFL